MATPAGSWDVWFGSASEASVDDVARRLQPLLPLEPLPRIAQVLLFSAREWAAHDFEAWRSRGELPSALSRAQYASFLRYHGPEEARAFVRARALFTEQVGPDRSPLLLLHSWYHGFAERGEIERLMASAPVGSFTVRVSATEVGSFAVTHCVAPASLRHLLMRHDPAGGFWLKAGAVFDTVTATIASEAASFHTPLPSRLSQVCAAAASRFVPPPASSVAAAGVSARDLPPSAPVIARQTSTESTNRCLKMLGGAGKAALLRLNEDVPVCDADAGLARAAVTVGGGADRKLKLKAAAQMHIDRAKTLFTSKQHITAARHYASAALYSFGADDHKLVTRALVNTAASLISEYELRDAAEKAHDSVERRRDALAADHPDRLLAVTSRELYMSPAAFLTDALECARTALTVSVGISVAADRLLMLSHAYNTLYVLYTHQHDRLNAVRVAQLHIQLAESTPGFNPAKIEQLRKRLTES